MGTLYIDRRNMRLKRETGAIALYQSGERLTTVPLNLLERVVMRGSVELDSGLLGALAENGTGLLILSGRHHRALATLLGRPHADARRRLAQYHAYEDADWRAFWSRRLVHFKLLAQDRLLRFAVGERPDRRHPLSKARAQLGDIIATVATSTETDLDRIRGWEGAGAAAYFGAYTQLFANSLDFTGRNRRPPRDPVNACLSLAYTLLHFEAALACHQAGLDPMVGFFHEPAYGRDSLAADAIEPLRARVDRWTWELFRGRVLREDHFSRDGGACLLSKAGRQVFFAEYEDLARPLRRLLRRTAYGVARHLLTNDRRGATR